MSCKKGGNLIRGNNELRFTSKTKQVGECVEWTGSLTHNGYGKFMVGAAAATGRTWKHIT